MREGYIKLAKYLCHGYENEAMSNECDSENVQFVG